MLANHSPSVLSAAFIFLLSSAATVGAWSADHRVSCNKVTKCNGNLMCAQVCEKGSVEVDDWAVRALRYQQTLQHADQWKYLQLPSTHNSAINEADGYGIEKYFISALYNGKDMDAGDDVGEGVCQYMTLTDQLRIGVRHLEIDLWWGTPLSDELIICHSPVPLIPPGNISRAAEEAGLDLQWDPHNMSCLGQRRQFTDVLWEIKDWMMLEENLDQIVVLFFDTKFYISPEHVTKSNNDILSVFGDMLWKQTDGSPLELSVGKLLGMGKRIMIENQREEWLHPSEGDALVFAPSIWTHQFGDSNMLEFPDCSIEGDSSWYGTTQVRALEDQSFIEAATRCGVQLVSPDYINADDMKLFVWSWDLDQPSMTDGCTAITPSGRWATLSCDMELPFACEVDGSYGNWAVDLDKKAQWRDGALSCAAGTTFSAPHNGFSNNKLMLNSYSQFLWLNAPNK